MRIAFGGYEHETNNFSSISVTGGVMDRIMRRDQELIDTFTGVHCMVGGVLDECAQLSIQAVPTIYGEAGPCAATEQAAFEAFVQELADRMWAAHCQAPLDAIVLTIHGAGWHRAILILKPPSCRPCGRSLAPGCPSRWCWISTATSPLK